MIKIEPLKFFIDSNGGHGNVDFSQKEFSYTQKSTNLYGFPSSIIENLCQGDIKYLIYDSISLSLRGFVTSNGEALLNFPRYNPEMLKKAHLHFREGLLLHDRLEKFYIENTNFSLLDELAESYSKKVIPKRILTTAPKRYDRFLGSATIYGAKDFVENLTSRAEKRYFIKGRPGTGKSTFMKKILSYALLNGYDSEVYHCSFDQKSIDMILFPELSLSFLDSTKPHEYFPKRESDEIIDLYEYAVKKGTDEKYHDRTEALTKSYKGKIDEAIALLKEADDIRIKNEKNALNLFGEESFITSAKNITGF